MQKKAINKIDSSLARFQNLKVLNLSHNKIQKLEEFINQLSQPKNNSDQYLNLAASKLSESALPKIWDN
jgi:Leucine-rich repeat (LRR) protein